MAGWLNNEFYSDARWRFRSNIYKLRILLTISYSYQQSHVKKACTIYHSHFFISLNIMVISTCNGKKVFM